MAAFLEDVKIIENICLGSRYYLLKVKSEKIIKEIKAGQFCMIKPLDNALILRRPISIHNIDKENGVLEFYYETVGKGTKELSTLKAGDIINIQGPLGEGFSINIKDKKIAIIGGGMGIAPLKELIKQVNKENKVVFIAGGRDKYAFEILKNINFKNTIVVSDDGSIGEKKNTVEKLKEILEKENINMIFTCGPHIMMEKVAEVAHKNNIYCEVSLEERMGCGTGACMGCSIETTKGMKKVCKDGPVFNSKEVIK
ncbi:dihydroorotate dehydrogenase electron transfer subunit [Hypnocyclicus thermotrophus]|uniref:Dihydroorotate dehydrogenase electron transfer subunit n=1 Tax=Hypnocyclicus thermotrophus TaxID=1627895 RepID=A0AA46DX11_9FUSO|nr:dihydroorotate dehydrogenase electron transfer subunit [Hypnocyclicus thermotrophus]TDT67403.1 dihydroorotate dehydrogenase electron transfer subunit [Hypnocyclicus thermotrophus]